MPTLGTICYKGEAAQVLNGEYGKYYGVGAQIAFAPTDDINAGKVYDGSGMDTISFKLTGPDATTAPIISKFTYIGVTDTVNLKAGSTEKIVYFQERAAPPTMPFTSGDQVLTVSDLAPLTSYDWDASAEALDKSNLLGFEITVQTNTDEAQPFDFCLSEIAFDGWVQPEPGEGEGGASGE